jgi:hypothetical protein
MTGGIAAMSDYEVPAPRIGHWYKDVAGERFEVVAIDEDDGTIEVQHFDGTVEELDMDAWQDMPIVHAPPPEDWSGSLDLEREDYGVDLDEFRDEHFGSALDYLDRAE